MNLVRWILVLWLVAWGFVGATSVYDVQMTLQTSQVYNHTGTYDWPDTPDKGSVSSADFLFKSGGEYTWKLNDGSVTQMTQGASVVGGRFFVGVEGSAGTLVFTSDQGSPGSLCAIGNQYASMRIADSAQTSGHGTVKIRGGVTVQVGSIFCQYASLNASLAVENGEFAVFSTDSSKRLNLIDVTVGANGKLWILDPSASVTSVSGFQTYASGSTLAAASGLELVFQTGVARTPMNGGSAMVGTLITTRVPLPMAPAVVQQPTSMNLREYDRLSLKVTASGTPPLEYQWQKDGADLIGFTESSLVIPMVGMSDAGRYRVKITGGAGEVLSDEAVITVQEYPKDLTASLALIARILPDHAAQFQVRYISPESGKDVYEYESVAGMIELRGNHGVSIASALNAYLREQCQCHVSRNGDQLKLPAVLPMVTQKVRVVSPHSIRFFNNPCTFGYSSAWWNWERWQREIDMLAMHGINVAQVTPGIEKVLLEAFTHAEVGYDSNAIRAWLCMPSHLPWMLLANMHSFGGPVPMSLIEKRAVLGRQIVDRMKSLGMEPMVQGYYGMVPQDFRTRYPQSTVLSQGTWAGGLQRPDMLSPTDAMFGVIATHYAQAIHAVYGDVRYAAADPFHEGGNVTGIDLPGASRAVLAGIDQIAPNATWVIEAWGSNPIQSMLDAVDKDRLLVLDLNCTSTESWRNRAAFNQTPWVWCTIQNFGGNTGMDVKLASLASMPSAALADRNRGRMMGVGVVPEGIETVPVVYEMMNYHGWNAQAPVLSSWIQQYTRQRYGVSDDHIDRAWSYLLDSTYHLSMSLEEPHNSYMNARPSLTTSVKARTWGSLTTPYDPVVFAKSWRELMEVTSSANYSDAYRFDLADVARQSLCDLVTRYQKQLAQAVTSQNSAEVRRCGDRMLEVMADLDRLCGTRREWLLGRWLADARSWGETTEDKDLCEKNARMLITTWNAGISNLNDYANRDWSGLISGFYRPRWQQFLTALYASMEGGATWNENTVRSQIGAWELQWTQSKEAYPVQPSGDTFAIAQELWAKYQGELLGEWDKTELAVGSTWSPAIVSSATQVWKRSVTNEINQPGTWLVTYQYTSGSHALQIWQASLDQQGSRVDVDEHAGWTGVVNRDNHYYLKVASPMPTTLDFYTKVSGAGGNDSNGQLTFSLCQERPVVDGWSLSDGISGRAIWTQDVTSMVAPGGIYRVTLHYESGTVPLEVDRIWFEQGGRVIGSEIRDETLSMASHEQGWTIPTVAGEIGPITMKIACGGQVKGDSVGSILIESHTSANSSQGVLWQAWSDQHGLGAMDDPDGDGVPAVIEFLQGRLPGQAQSEAAMVLGKDMRLRLNYLAGRLGLVTGVEASQDLQIWQDLSGASVESDASVGGLKRQRVWKVPQSQEKTFYRLKAKPQ